MSRLEAASSLFGPSDTSSDPFGAIGSEDDVSAQRGQTQNSTSPTNQDIADVFGLNTWETQGDARQQAYHLQDNTSWSDVPAQDGHHDAQHYPYSEAIGGAGYNLQPARSAYGGIPATSAYNGYVNGSYAYTTPNVSSSPYAPPPASRPVENLYTAFPSTDTQPSPYAPAQNYVPTQPSTQIHVPPPQPTNPLHRGPPYDPYQVSSYAHSSLPATPPSAPCTHRNGYSVLGHGTSPPSVPAPTADTYRPKTSNAYDPPLPPAKPRRLMPAARTASPAIGQQKYPVYGQSPNTAFSAASQAYGFSPPPRNTSVPPYTSPPASSLPPQSSYGARAHTPNPPPPPPPRSSSSISTAREPPTRASHHEPTNGNAVEHAGAADGSDSAPVRTTTSLAADNGVAQNLDFLEGGRDDGFFAQLSSDGTLGAVDSLPAEENHHPHDSSFHDEAATSSFEVGPTGVHRASIGEHSPSDLTQSPKEDNVFDVEGHAEDFVAGAGNRTFKPEDDASSIEGGAPLTGPSSSDFVSLPQSIASPPQQNPYAPNPPAHYSSPPQVASRAFSPSTTLLQVSGRGSIDGVRSNKSDAIVESSPTSVYDPYNPAGLASRAKPVTGRVSSPSASSIKSGKSTRSAYDPYTSPTAYTGQDRTRERSVSNGSAYSTMSVKSAHDHYAPTGLSPYSPPAPAVPYVSKNAHAHPQATRVNGTLEIAPPQIPSYTSPTQAPYAPSPSLLGTNDPLGRTGCRAPVVSFGCGGKFVICNHGSNTLNTGFDVALSSRQTTNVEIKLLHTIVPESAMESSSSSFPGPLFCDPGTPSASLVRTGASTQIKNNKLKVIKYLEDRGEETSRGMGYLTQGTPARKEAEGKLVLVRLLKVLVENDGQLSGSPQIEKAVRSALVPRLDETSQASGVNTLPSGTDLAFNALDLGTGNFGDNVLATSTVKTSALDKIGDFLIQGDRRGAYHYALDERLWAHAMVIASSIDKEAWKEVVNEFVKTEVGASAPGKESGRESLKAAYTLYSGQGATAVNSLAAPTSLAKLTDGLRPRISHAAPTSPNFHASSPPSPVSAETLAKWPETVAMMLGGPSPAECSTALMSLGDCLLANQWPEAAHVCYLLAPQTPILSNMGSTSGRVALLGSRGPLAVPNFHVEHDPIIFSEILEFAMSLPPTSKGETFPGFPHLQPYKLIRAASLAEMGHVQAANRYCEAIASSLGRAAGFPGPDFVEQLKELSDRLIGVPQLDKTGSWKLNKPSLDKIGSWLEGSLTKFIAGDGEHTTAESHDTASQERMPFAGPFAHYSTISSAASSKPSSPQPTGHNPHNLADAYPAAPRRTGSAHSMRPLMNPHVSIDRASSAMDYRPRNSSPGPRIVSASATTTTFTQSSSYYRGFPNGLQSVPDGDDDDNAQTAVGVAPQGVWWGSATEETSTVTPTAATFYQVDRAASPSTSGFVSLMDDTTFGAPSFNSSATTPNPTSKHSQLDEDEDDDLGLSNSSSKKTAAANGEVSPSESKPPEAKDIPTRPEAKPVQGASSGRSWLNPIGWWKGSSSGPIKATLGEESSFVYDAELKRWINKKAGAGPAKPATPPPPPSRAQTASPGHSTLRMPNGISPAPPPARAASAVDLTGSPPKRTIPRMRSNLVPVDTAVPLPPSRTSSPGLAPPTPHGGFSVARTPPPTPGRPKSQASKRNIRSRYVDIFQQPAEGS